MGGQYDALDLVICKKGNNVDCDVIYLNIIIETSKVNYGWEIDDSSEWNNSLDISIVSS